MRCGWIYIYILLFYFKMFLEHHYTRMIIYSGNSSRYISMDVPNLIECSPNYWDLKPNFDSTFTVAADCREYFIWITFAWWRYSLAEIVFDCCLFISTQVRYDAKYNFNQKCYWSEYYITWCMHRNWIVSLLYILKLKGYGYKVSLEEVGIWFIQLPPIVK